MMPGGFGGFGTGDVEIYGGFDVNTFDSDGNILGSEYFSNINDANAAAAEIQAEINSSTASAYQSYFRQVGENIANTNWSLDNGCPDGVDCGEGMQRGSGPIPIGDRGGGSRSSTSNSQATGGSFVQFSAGFAFAGGFGIAVGKVYDAMGNSKWYFTFDGNIGYGLGGGLEGGVIS